MKTRERLTSPVSFIEHKNLQIFKEEGKRERALKMI